MSRKGVTPIIGSLLLLGILAQGISSKSAPSTASFWTLQPPAAALDFDEGLDARDAYNRPVASAAARQQLRELFVDQFYALVLNPLLTQRASLNDLIQQIWQSVTARLAPYVPVHWFKNFAVSAPSAKKGFFYAALAFLLTAGLKKRSETRRGAPGFHDLQQLLCQSSVLLRV